MSDQESELDESISSMSLNPDPPEPMEGSIEIVLPDGVTITSAVDALRAVFKKGYLYFSETAFVLFHCLPERPNKGGPSIGGVKVDFKVSSLAYTYNLPKETHTIEIDLERFGILLKMSKKGELKLIVSGQTSDVISLACNELNTYSTDSEFTIRGFVSEVSPPPKSQIPKKAIISKAVNALNAYNIFESLPRTKKAIPAVFQIYPGGFIIRHEDVTMRRYNFFAPEADGPFLREFKLMKDLLECYIKLKPSDGSCVFSYYDPTKADYSFIIDRELGSYANAKIFV